MDQKRKNTQSAKVITEINEWTGTLKSHTPNKTQYFFYASLKLNNNVHTDETRKIRARSSRRYNCIIITHCYDSNSILVRPLRSRKGFELAETIKEMHENLGARGCKPNCQRLDNETSPALKEYLKSENVTFQLVSPHIHRINSVERAMRTFKPISYQCYA